jgi:Mce-associated membrane protein
MTDPQNDWTGRPSRWELTLGAMALGLVAALIVLQIQRADPTADHETAAGRGAIRAAEAQVLALTTLDHRRIDDQVELLQSGAAGSFRDQLDQRLDQFVAVVRTEKLRATGHVVGSGLVSLSEDGAAVIVVSEADVSSRDGRGGQKHRYRFRVGLIHKGDRWLVSDMEALA